MGISREGDAIVKTLIGSSLAIALMAGFASAEAQTSPRPTHASAPTASADAGMAKAVLPVLKEIPKVGTIAKDQFFLVDDKGCVDDSKMTMVTTHGTKAGTVAHTVVCAVIESGSNNGKTAKAQFPLGQGDPKAESVRNGTVLLFERGCGKGYAIISGGDSTADVPVYRATGCAVRG